MERVDFAAADVADQLRERCAELLHYRSLPVTPDVLTAGLTVSSLRQIGGNDIIGTTSEVTDASGALVCATSATLVHRGTTDTTDTAGADA